MDKSTCKQRIFNKDFLSIAFVALGLSIHFYYFHNLLFTKPENPTWIDVINSVILLVTLTAFCGLFLMGFFSFVTRDAESVEKWALRNLTKVCYFIGLLLVSSFIFKYLLPEQFLTSFGALIVFWYGYKKYERDKEIQLIERYTEKYNRIYDEITQKLMDKENEIQIKKVDFKDIFNLWYEEFFLYTKGYIAEDLWIEWLFWIKQDINLFISKTCDQYIKIEELSEKHNKNYTIVSVLTGMNGIIPMVHFRKVENNQKIGIGFKNLMIGIIQGEINILLKTKELSKEKKDWYKLLNESLSKI